MALVYDDYTRDRIGWFFGLEYLGDAGTPEDAAALAAQSPMAHVDAVRTPTLVIHSENDWRCPVEQGQRWFVEPPHMQVSLIFLPHDVVPPGTAARWIERLLALDWKRLDAAAFAAVNLARVTDDRARDLPPALREQVLLRLRALHAPASWLAMVTQKVELDEATERRMLGESLPPGLRLMA